jgi:hypothetical protein
MRTTRRVTAVVIAVVATACGTAPRAHPAVPRTDAPGAVTTTRPERQPAGPGGTSGPAPAGQAATSLPPPGASGSPAPFGAVAAPGTGQWKATSSLGGVPVMWTASFTIPGTSPAVTVSAAEFDQTRLHAALFNGNQLPGGGPWTNGDHVSTAALPSLVAAFNGGFLFQHIRGGYFSEGTTAKTLTAGQATLGVRSDGRLVLGVYGRDITNDGSYVSLRQNLPPIVDRGKPSSGQYPGTYWGNDFHNVWDTYRSAVCNRSDGRLMYVVIGNVNVAPFASDLAAMGCVTAMELDINGHWPQFAWYRGFGTANRNGVLLDPRMTKPNRYLNGSEKDFIALFDPATLPPGAVS